ncbi:prostatic acid phosphatase isoform X1 [Nematostella vectensis]|uniref:prostatic acid phosphatase isoform X1 n=2 Tax=Nematostella vectensis TaxID=45351 RepID=UPI0020778187|nr:prostatic acid phosphatase isoform X1 [Nematostella vectensis]
MMMELSYPSLIRRKVSGRVVHFLVVFLLSLLCSSISITGSPLIKQVVVISRHGSRGFLTKHHKTFVEGGDSSLTVRGMDEMFMAGEYIRRQYNESTHLNLLTEKYNASEVYVRSSDFARTLNSASSFLLGLYPPMNQTQSTSYGRIYSAPYNIQQVPIHTVDVENDQLLRGWMNCSTFQKKVSAFYNSEQFTSYKSQSANFLKELEDLTGMEDIQLENFYNVYDFIHLHRVYGDTSLNLTKGQWQRVQSIAAWVESHKFSFDVIGSKGGGILANEIAENFQETKTGHRKAKLLYYSAHYPTITSLFATLGLDKDLTLHSIPSYASLVIIELLQTNVGEYNVRFGFRDGPDNDTGQDPLQFHVLPGCKETLCPLETFIKHVTSLQVRDQMSWCDACGNTELQACKLGKLYTRTLAMTAVGGFFTGVFVTIILTVILVASWFMFLKKRCLPNGARPAQGLPNLEHRGDSRIM